MTFRSFVYVFVFSFHVMSTLSIAKSNDSVNEFKNAIILKNLSKIQQLLNADIKPDDKLIVFAMDNRLSGNFILNMIQVAKYDVNHIFSNGITLKQYALTCMDFEVILHLLKAGISFHNDFADIVFWGKSSFADTIKLIEAFLQYGYTPDFFLKTSCFVFNFMGNLEERNNQILNLLLANGLSPNATFGIENGLSMSLLHFFISPRCYKNFVYGQKLIEYGVDVNQVSTSSLTNKQVTPLSFALELRKLGAGVENDKIIEILVKHGAVL